MSTNADAIAQLARTVLGAAAGRWAEQAASVTSGEAGSPPWLLDGVVWQRCRDCEKVCHPPRPLCPGCLSEQLDWQRGSGRGRLLSFTRLEVSFNDFYHAKGPWLTGLVGHEDGPNFYVFLDGSLVKSGEEVALFTARDIIGEVVFIGVKPGDRAAERGAAFAGRLATLANTSN